MYLLLGQSQLLSVATRPGAATVSAASPYWPSLQTPDAEPLLGHTTLVYALYIHDL